jgi:cysteinyl-tRNA synthetase
MDAFKSMVQDLRNAESNNPNVTAKKLVCAIIPGFEDAMNDDLNVKAAFDFLFDIVSKLDSLNETGGLGAQDAKVALEELERVDRVLKIIF